MRSARRTSSPVPQPTSESFPVAAPAACSAESGRAAGVTTYLVETGYGASEKHSTNATYVVADLLTAVRHILGERKKPSPQ